MRSGIAIRIETAEGFRGEGEASPLTGFAGGSLAQTAVAVERLAHSIVGHPLDDLPDIDEPLANVNRSAAGAARCGIETAIADAAAVARGVPLWSLLGERSVESASDGAVSIPVNAIVDDSEPMAVAAATASAAERGFGTVKLKVGGDVTFDADRVAAARAAGPQLELRVDANGAWSVAEASLFLGRIAALDVALCEEPIRPGPNQRAELARLGSSYEVPLGVDESCKGPEDLAAVAEAGAARVVVLKPMVLGLYNAVEMLGMASELGLRTIVTTTFDAGWGTLAAAHVAALLPDPVEACGLATLERLEDTLVEGEPPIHGGRIELPDTPGLGCRAREDALAAFASELAGRVVDD